MKFVVLAAFLLTCPLWGQTSSAPSPRAGKPQATATAKSSPESAMMTQCMESMKKGLASAEKNLTDMKAALAQLKTDDPAARRLAELNVQMWENEVGHMKEMAAMHDKMKGEMKDHMKSMHSDMDSMKQE